MPVKKKTTLKKTPNLDEIRKEIGLLVDAAAAAKAKSDAAAKRAQAAKRTLDEYEVKIAAMADEILGPQDAGVVDGERKSVTIGAHGKDRKITDKDKLTDLLMEIDEDLPLKIARFNLGDIDKNLRPAEIEQVVETTYTGARKLTYGDAAKS